MHKLQQHVLKKLIMHDQQRYADLKPKPIEGNLFTYHLNQLIKDGLINKIRDGLYELSPDGKIYADRLSLKTFEPRQQPRIVTLMVITNDKGETLLYRRLRQPMINKIGFPYGKFHVGETVTEAANRELMEKTGLECKLTHRGDGYITICENGEPVSEILFHLFTGENPTGKLIRKSKVGEAWWEKHLQPDSPDYLPSVKALLELLEKNKNQHFFAELNFKDKRSKA